MQGGFEKDWGPSQQEGRQRIHSREKGNNKLTAGDEPGGAGNPWIGWRRHLGSGAREEEEGEGNHSRGRRETQAASQKGEHGRDDSGAGQVAGSL
jgi:hypothetical protein